MEPTGKLSVRSQCELLGIHRSGLYYAPARERAENLVIMRLLDERYLDMPHARGAPDAGLPAG